MKNILDNRNFPRFILTLLLAVHNSGVISGTFMNNGAVRCGLSVCRPISGIFTKNSLTQGYHHIATIPAGASNITITELQNSMNFLVLKTAEQKFVINGDYTISLSGPYDAAGTIFDYRRIDGLTNGSSSGIRKIEGVTEWITCPGPTTESVHLLLLSQQPNPGVKYEYLLPVNTQPNELNSEEDDSGNESSEGIGSKHILKSAGPANINTTHTPSTPSTPNSRPTGLRKRRFLWKVVGFNACSKSCGGGIQSPIIKCVREAPTRVFSPKRCAHLKQPVLNDNVMKCNTQPCPAYWKISDWTECNCGNFNEEVFQTREVKCVQELMSGIVIQVSNGACMEEQPPAREKCECVKHLKTPQLEVYKHKPNQPSTINNHHHHNNHHHNNHNTQNDVDAPGINSGRNRFINGTLAHPNRRVSEPKKTGVWLTADWNQRCSASCGVGLQHRSIFCDRNSSPSSERCDLRFTPDTTRECTSDQNCDYGEWFIGPWSLCSGDCFNLTRSRTVICIKNDGFASDSDCNLDERPRSIESCDIAEIADCKPRWHYSDWSECTKSCDGGSQRRVIKCLEPNLREKQMKESQSCRYADRPIAYKTCNTNICTETTTTASEPYADPRVDLIQNDSTCRDDFPNCNIVMKARLCSYAYYNEHCCQTCRSKSNELY